MFPRELDHCSRHQWCVIRRRGGQRLLLRIRIVRKPPSRSVDGIRLDCFFVGSEYELGNSVGALFLAEGWAEPVPLDEPAPYVPFSEGDPFTTRVVGRTHPRNLIRESYPPFIDDAVHAVAVRENGVSAWPRPV